MDEINKENISNEEAIKRFEERIDNADTDSKAKDDLHKRGQAELAKFLTERGFVNAQGDHTNDSGTSKGTSMIAPSGFSIALSYHRRKGDPDRA